MDFFVALRAQILKAAAQFSALGAAAKCVSKARVSQVRAAGDRIDSLARRDPDVARILNNLPADDAYHILRRFPPPAHRPKGLSAETEDQLKQMTDIIAREGAKNPRAAANLVVQSGSVMTDKKNRVDYLVRLLAKRGKK